MNNISFNPGETYRRRDLHEKYGGQEQGGISTPAKYPIIMLFTGDSGEQYGYSDGWNTDDIFLYTGEGQVGDMEMIRGNRAIKDHVENNKVIHLFKNVKTGFVEYMGEMKYQGHREVRGPDRDNKQRKIIVFELTPIDR
jgi:5-methylcytosine-specific restriction protein A